jgi:hypothetical protein
MRTHEPVLIVTPCISETQFYSIVVSTPNLAGVLQLQGIPSKLYTFLISTLRGTYTVLHANTINKYYN